MILQAQDLGGLRARIGDAGSASGCPLSEGVEQGLDRGLTACDPAPTEASVSRSFVADIRSTAKMSRNVPVVSRRIRFISRARSLSDRTLSIRVTSRTLRSCTSGSISSQIAASD
jgi:hypothetical protein